MTIKELYEWAKEKNVLDYDLSIDVEFGNFGLVDIKDLKIDKDYGEIIVVDY